MKFGVWLDFSPGSDLAGQIEQQAPLLDRVDGSALHGAWVGQSRKAGFPSPLVVLGGLALRWGVPVGTGVSLIPGTNPVKLAEDALVLNRLSEGRFTLGLAAGQPTVSRFYGLRAEPVGDYIDEYLSTMVRLWRGERVRGGRFFDVDAVLRLDPGEAPPRLWIGGHTKRAITRAARFGSGFYLSSTPDFDEMRERTDLYRAKVRGAERGPAGTVAINRFVVVRKDAAEARRAAAPTALAGLMSYVPAGEPGTVPDVEAYARGRAVVGDPADVAEQLLAYQRAGVDYLVLRLGNASTPITERIRTLDVLIDHVLPRIRATDTEKVHHL